MTLRFDHERLDVYQLELQFLAWVTPLLEQVNQRGARTREVCDQLDRASLSSLLNTAEGNGRRQRRVRSRFFDEARGSATECAACLDALVAKGAAEPSEVAHGKELLLRIVSMLCRLVERFDSPPELHEDSGAYGAVPAGSVDAGESSSLTTTTRRTRTRTTRRTETAPGKRRTTSRNN